MRAWRFNHSRTFIRGRLSDFASDKCPARNETSRPLFFFGGGVNRWGRPIHILVNFSLSVCNIFAYYFYLFYFLLKSKIGSCKTFTCTCIQTNCCEGAGESLKAERKGWLRAGWKNSDYNCMGMGTLLYAKIIEIEYWWVLPQNDLFSSHVEFSIIH